ncbi:MAG: hypothetical protein C4334_09150 [Pyrinomonas sp.]
MDVELLYGSARWRAIALALSLGIQLYSDASSPFRSENDEQSKTSEARLDGEKSRLSFSLD